MSKPASKKSASKAPASAKFDPSAAPEGLEQERAPETMSDDGDVEGETESTPTPQAPVPQPMAQQARTYKGSQQVDHDLFKLENALLKRNLSYDGQEPLIDHITHSHHFHSVDSNGRKLDRSTSVGGHFHPITVKHSATGVPELVVGPPMREVLKKKGNRKVKVAIPCTFSGAIDDNGDEVIDTHTHKVTYLGSEKVMLREASVEAAKFTAALDLKRNIPSSVEGVTGG